MDFRDLFYYSLCFCTYSWLVEVRNYAFSAFLYLYVPLKSVYILLTVNPYAWFLSIGICSILKEFTIDTLHVHSIFFLFSIYLRFMIRLMVFMETCYSHKFWYSFEEECQRWYTHFSVTIQFHFFFSLLFAMILSFVCLIWDCNNEHCKYTSHIHVACSRLRESPHDRKWMYIYIIRPNTIHKHTHTKGPKRKYSDIFHFGFNIFRLPLN